MKEIELINKRKLREKHFLQEDGTIVAKIYGDDIHYYSDGKYKEIDNIFIKDKNQFVSLANSYKVFLNKDYLFQIKKDEHFINFKLKNKNKYSFKIIKNSKLHSIVNFKNILENIDIQYDFFFNKIKESIILKNNTIECDNLIFEIDTDLQLILNNQSLVAYNNDQILFSFDTPFMFDGNEEKNTEITYELKYDSKYYLKLNLNKRWLFDSSRLFPVVIDPTIKSDTSNLGLYDTYIFSGDKNINCNNKDILKVGVEKVDNKNRINRALLKFDLPEIGTGSQIIESKINLIGYGSSTYCYDTEMLSIHAVTQDWNENTANWDQMYNKYNSYCEGCFESHRSYVANNQLNGWICSADITNLVKKWYTDLPNYGMLIKAFDESYKSSLVPAFYSKNNTMSGDNPKPTIEITYRNQNGLLDYLEYDVQNFFSGKSFVNLFNGNLTALFCLGNTNNKKFPSKLNLIYNTNDVVLENDKGLGTGFRFNYNQTIKKVKIGSKYYLEYNDWTGTLRYFNDTKETFDEFGNINTVNESNTYYDEDGLNMNVVESEDCYTLTDSSNSKMIFIKNNSIGILDRIIDSENNSIKILYDSDGKITSIVNEDDNNSISISYGNNCITIVSNRGVTTLSYENGKLTNLQIENRNIQINYADNNIISSIIDNSGKSFEYQYYTKKPYRIKKVTELGLNNEIGNYNTFYYGTASTTITDYKNRTITMTFDNYGRIASTSNIPKKGNIVNGYGKREYYGTGMQNQNHLIQSDNFIKSVLNLLSNISFEENNINFVSYGANVSITNEYARSGKKSLKIIFNSLSDYVLYPVSDLIKNKDYSFSSYIKSNGNISLSLYYNNGDKIINKSVNVNSSDKFARNGLSIFYSENATSDLYIKISPINLCNVFIDDIQLEEGDTINYFNYIENGDFSKGFSGWLLERDDDNYNQSFSIINVSDNKKALKIKMNPNHTTALLKDLVLEGNKNDSYTISFWYKNSGVRVDEINSFNDVTVVCKDTNGDGGCALASDQLNINLDEWQFFSETFNALTNYNLVEIAFAQAGNANELIITNICLFKNFKNISFNRNESGNISKSIVSENGKQKEKEFLYNSKNKLIGVFGDNTIDYNYEYDDNSKIISGIASNGFSNKLKYDSDGKNNTIVSTYNDFKLPLDTEINCKIRINSKNNYISFKYKRIFIDEEKSDHTLWKIIPILVDNIYYYRISNNIIKDRYFGIYNNTLVLCNETNSTLFNIEKTKTNSYNFKIKDSDLYLYFNNGKLYFKKFEEKNDSFNFFIEGVKNKYFFEGNNLGSNEDTVRFRDTILREMELDYDKDNKTLTSAINYNGQISNYEYDNKNRLINIKCNEYYISYDYYSNDKLKGINHHNKYYNFEYDEFLNQKNIRINDNLYITNYFEQNNGNLNKIKYGNNQEIQFEYDDFDRIIKIYKNDNIYNIKYDSNNNVYQIISNDNIETFIYDLFQKVSKYINDSFLINYNYDELGNVNQKEYTLDNEINVINYIIDNNIITSQKGNDYIINYNYDDLNRISNKTINNYNISYDYMRNGTRTSSLLKSYSLANNKYVFKYNKLLNVSHIYYNDRLVKKYIYDDLSQLISSYDFNLGIINRYKYDSSGNIVCKSKYKINDFSLISVERYEYSCKDWEDLLIKYNNQNIMYDEIGNPISIGDNIILRWNNGRELVKYDDSLNNINIEYKYDQNGIRTEKVVNNIVTNYYLENKKIIYEKTNKTSIFFIYEKDGNIIGLKYNNNNYYYIKNALNDIIGIIDDNNNILANYLYDDWGNILSIKDINNNEITDSNHIAMINPFRYRSYYYDKETKLYYLNDRYYNPQWCRFINADKIIGSNMNYLGYNLFIYCSNNPINGIDETGNGKFLSTLFKIAFFPVVVRAKLTNLISSGINKLISVEVSQSFGKDFKGTTSGGPLYKETKGTRLYKSQTYVKGDNSKPIKVKVASSTDFKEESHSVTIDGGSHGASLNLENNGLSTTYHKYYNGDVSANVKIGVEIPPTIIGMNIYIEGSNTILREDGTIVENYIRNQVNLIPATVIVFSPALIKAVSPVFTGFGKELVNYVDNLIEPLPALFGFS